MDTAASNLDWRKLFGGVEDQSLTYFPAEVLEGVFTVKPPVAVIDEGIAEWRYAVVGQFIGVAPNFGSMQKTIEILWGKASAVKVSFAGPNLYVFSFSNASIRDWVLDNGPWHIQNKPLLLRKWEPNLQKLNLNLMSIPIWVQLYNVPLELFSRNGLSYIASVVGHPLYMDSITASKQRLEYAKVCVEIGVDTVIPEIIHVALKDGSIAKIRVYVPWLPKVCSHCKIFGHFSSACSENHKVPLKGKDTQIWRRKVASGSSVDDGQEKKLVGDLSHAISSGCSTEMNIHVGDDTESLGLQVGAAVEVTVEALQERSEDIPQEVAIPTKAVVEEANQSVNADVRVRTQEIAAPDKAIVAGTKIQQFVTYDAMVQAQDIIVPAEIGEADKKMHQSVITGAGVRVVNEKKTDSLSHDQNAGDLPPLQGSIPKKNSKGRKKDNSGSSSKLEQLAGGAGMEGNRKPRAAALGVSLLLNEIKSKKKDMVEKVVGNGGPPNLTS
ncbi:uncharacterized protein LOC120198847 [Hibiscus syriacus]|uniref:uncharacterized protein LOC120198847 n=1 Tax=Hibiscus syriacus TaxID=106335 RepID=UPI001923886B|nr:uncharacterized protein LOC120198847 [Hibiscus syriacus]